MSHITFDANLLLSVVINLGIAVFVIGRQFTTQRLNPATLVVLPAVLLFLALRAPGALAVDGAAAVSLAVQLVLAAGLGVVRAMTMRIWAAGADFYRKGTLLTLGAWVLSIGVRIAFLALGHHSGAPMVSQSELLLFIAVTLGAQNLAVWFRTRTLVQVAVRV